MGIGIGIVSQLIIALILTKEEIGVLALLNSVSNMIATIFCLGFAQITFQIFASFRNEENGHYGFFLFGVFFTLAGVLLGELTFYFFEDLFIGVGDEYKLIRSLSFLIFPLIFFRIFFKNYDVYLRMLFSSVAGAFLEGVLLRVVVLFGIVVFWLDWIEYEGLAIIYTIGLSLPGLIIVILSLMRTNKITLPKKEIFASSSPKKIAGYGLYGILAAASGIIVMTIDQLMLNQMINTEAVGVYSVIFFAAALISVPARGIKRIAVPVLTESWKNDDFENIEMMYRKSVVNQTILAFYIFIIGWACIEPALYYVPKYEEGLYVFFFLGLGQLFDMMTGLNLEVLLTSKSFKMNTYFNVALAILVVVFNYFFIQEWGIVGSAAASALAMFIMNMTRFVYLKRTYNLSAFSKPFYITSAIGIVLILLVSFVPIPLNPLWQIIAYTVVITIVYWMLVLRLKLSEDMNLWIVKIKKRFLG